jgi:hypothetical protein
VLGDIPNLPIFPERLDEKLMYAMATLLVLAAAPITAGAAGSTSNPDWQYPEIENFGRIQPPPDAVNQPALDETHKAALSDLIIYGNRGYALSP